MSHALDLSHMFPVGSYVKTRMGKEYRVDSLTSRQVVSRTNGPSDFFFKEYITPSGQFPAPISLVAHTSVECTQSGVWILGVWFQIIKFEHDIAVFRSAGVIAINHSARMKLKELQVAMGRVHADIEKCSNHVAAASNSTCADELVQHLVEKHHIERHMKELEKHEREEVVEGLSFIVRLNEWTEVADKCVSVPGATAVVRATCI
jgi:hypothetical protein